MCGGGCVEVGGLRDVGGDARRFVRVGVERNRGGRRMIFVVF